MIFDKNTTIVQFNSYIVNSYQTLTKLKMGRPPTKPARLKNGFYVGVKNKGMASPVMMYSPTREGMMLIAQRYGVFPEKEVVVMGEHKNDKWVDQEQPKRGRKKKEVAEN